MGLFKVIRRLILRSINLELELLIKKFQPKQALEIGCGFNSPFITLLNKHQVNCFGLDIDPKVITQLKESASYKQVIWADATKIPLKNGIFDMVIIGFVLHGVTATNRAMIVLEAKRVLKNNGLLVIIDVCTPASWIGRGLSLWCDLEEKFLGRLNPEHYYNYRDFLKNDIEGTMVDNPTNLITKTKKGFFGNIRLLCFWIASAVASQ